MTITQLAELLGQAHTDVRYITDPAEKFGDLRGSLRTLIRLCETASGALVRDAGDLIAVGMREAERHLLDEQQAFANPADAYTAAAEQLLHSIDTTVALLKATR